MSGHTVPHRSEIPVEQRWHAESVFATPEAWDQAFEQVQTSLSDISGFAGTLDRGPERLADWFEVRDRIVAVLGALRVYTTMAFNVDSHDREAQIRQERLRGLLARFAETSAFEDPELLAIGVDTLRSWQERDERLAHYGHAFDLLERRAAHTRSPEVEALLGAVSGPFSSATQTHGVLANSDLEFADAVDSSGEHYDVTQGSIGTLLASDDRSLRRSAYEHYADAHRTFRTTMANLLGTGIHQNLLFARARRYDSALHASMSPHGLPLEVFHNLLATFTAHLPTWHRYWRAKRRILQLNEFHPYDIKAPMTPDPPHIPYEQAVGWLADALAPLGSEYVDTLRHGALEGRWVDRSVNRGKRMGAFSNGVQGTPPFIMMSYSEDVFGMSTLAHELGHSLHSYFSWRHQPPVYSDYSLFAAEVASNFNQAMLRAHLTKLCAHDRSMQIALIEETMANFYRYFFVMPTLARFEYAIHQRAASGAALSADTLDGLMADLFAEGFGDEVVFDRARVGITWAQFHTHLYSRFYVYQYATGIAGAHALAHGILAGHDGAAERYLDFLRAGGSKDPLDALQDAGVDLNTPASVEKAFEELAGIVDRLEELAR